MIKKLILGAALGAVAMFITGIIFWVILIVPFTVLNSIPNEMAVAQALDENLISSGVYVLPFPDMDTGAMDETFIETHKRGPLAQIFFQKRGVDPTSPRVFILGFLHFFISALLVGGLMLMALPQLNTYRMRVLFVFLAGVFAAISVNLSNPIWWHHPWGFHVYSAVFNITGWFLAGLVMAWIIKPTS